MAGQPVFLIQIVDVERHQVVRIPGGGQLERNLIQEVVKRTVSRGVGYFRSEEHVSKAITEAITEVVRELKMGTLEVVK